MEKQSRLGAVPERSEDFAHLPLMGLRQYRKALTQEENRVSYWRRIIQARLDMVRAVDSPGTPMQNLGSVLTSERVDRGRQALIEILPIDDIPPLPNLEEIWQRSLRPGDEAHNQQLTADLVKAEAQLSAYRLALHRRLTAATGELIARYRENPQECLTVLPLPQQKDTAARLA